MKAVAEKEVEVVIPYKSLPKQGEFHACSAQYRGFGGGWGNGKTSAGCMEALALALEYPGCVGLIARKTRPELKATTQHVFFHGGGGNPETDWPGCPQELIKSFNKTEQRLELINGSIIHFWPLDDPDKLSNLNLGWFLIDQAEEVAEEMFLMLCGRLRQLEAPRKGMVLFNPAGHDWIWKRFAGEYPGHKMIHATTLDNPNLPTDYIDSLMHMPEKWVQRFVMGSFDVFEGQIWPDFDPDVHLIQPFEIPDWFEIIEGIDHGRRNPTAILWAAFDNQGNCFIVDEHYEAGKLVTHHANKLLDKREIWGEPEYTVIDASAAQEDPNTGRSVIDEYWDHGITTVPSDRHVIARINRVAEWLRPDPKHPHPVTGELHPEASRGKGYPHLYVFKSVLELPEHIQQYQWRRKPPTQEADAKEEPLKKDDHDVDAMGYILMTRPEPATAPEGKRRGPNDLYWERVRKRMDQASRGNRGNHSMLGSEA